MSQGKKGNVRVGRTARTATVNEIETESNPARDKHTVLPFFTAIDMIPSYENKLGAFFSPSFSRCLLRMRQHARRDDKIHSTEVLRRSSAIRRDVRIISELLQVDVHRVSFVRIANEQIPLGDKPAARPMDVAFYNRR